MHTAENIIRAESITADQERFFNKYCAAQWVRDTTIWSFFILLSNASQLSDTRLEFYGSPDSDASLKLVAEMHDPDFSREMKELADLNDRQKEERGLARAVLAYELLERDIGGIETIETRGLFEGITLTGGPRFSLSPRSEPYALRAS